LGNNRAGVLVLPSFSYNLNNRQTLDVDATSRTWKNQGRPTVGELYTSSPKAGSAEKIEITVMQKVQMKQFVWFLHVEEFQGETLPASIHL
jgi:hypothetical protein